MAKTTERLASQSTFSKKGIYASRFKSSWNIRGFDHRCYVRHLRCARCHCPWCDIGLYLDIEWKKRCASAARPTVRDLYEAVVAGAVDRVRPKMMTSVAIMGGLLPILWGSGTGASVMKRIAAPMVGGMISSAVLTLIVIPAVYSLWKERSLRAEVPDDAISHSYGPLPGIVRSGVGPRV